MKKVIGTIAVVAVVAGVAVLALSQAGSANLAQVNTPFSEAEREFINYIARFRKNYFSKEEYNYRLDIFEKNFNLVQTHNSKNGASYTLAINHISDLSPYEFKNNFLGFAAQEQQESNAEGIISDNGYAVASSIDWRQKGAVTAVKNQGQCGSCWSFSTTGAVEGYHFIKSGSLVALSEQELMDCSWLKGNMGCNGGLMDRAFGWVAQHGLETEADYPYTAKSSFSCKRDDSKMVSGTKISGHKDVQARSSSALKAALNNGPVSVAIEADKPEFQQYSSGVFDGNCGTTLDHGVLAVGYGSTGGKAYWIVKNSWGASWGDNGYIKLVDNGDGAGQCGILMQASQPSY